MVDAVEPSFTVDALGSTVRVRWRSDGAAEPLAAARRAWSRCLVEPDEEADLELTVAVAGLLDAEDEAATDVVGRDDVEALEVATAGVTVLAIQELAGQRLMLHACAVADPDTRKAVVMVGPSGAGKTTIAATLGKHWAYVTDETVAIDDDGVALAYPKPLCVVDGDSKVQHSPDDLGLVEAPEEVEVAKVLLIDRRPGLTGAELEPVATAEAIALLAEHTSYLTRLDQPLHWLGGLARVTGGVARVSYSEATQLEPIVAELLGGER